MGRYIDSRDEIVYKYAFNQSSNMNLIYDVLGIGRLRRYTAEESGMNGNDMLFLNKEDINELQNYYDKRAKRVETLFKLRQSFSSAVEKSLPYWEEDLPTAEENFINMIGHMLHYAKKHPDRECYDFCSEL